MLLVFVFVLKTTPAQVNFNENIWLSSASFVAEMVTIFLYTNLSVLNGFKSTFFISVLGGLCLCFERINDLILENLC